MDNFTLKEFIKRYSGTYLILKDAKTSKLKAAYLRGDRRDNDGDNILDFEGFNLDAKKILIEEQPYRVCFNVGHEVAVFSRLPERQWKKGFTSSNTEIRSGFCLIAYALNADDWNINTRSAMRLNTELFQAMADRTYLPSIADATKGRRLQTCITPTYWISRTFSNDGFILFRYEIPVASYDVGADTLTPLNPIYLQELLDLVSRLDLTTKVKS